MKKLLHSFVVLFVIIGLGVGVIYWRRRHRQINKPWAANPCPNRLASVDNTLQPTLNIGLLETSCENTTASVHFNVTNVGRNTIKYFQVRAIYTYDNYVADGASVGTGPLAPGASNDSYIGMGPPRLANDKPVGQLRSITLAAAMLESPDGTIWRQPSIHEPRPPK